MAAAENETKSELFETLFSTPSIEAMLALSWQDFQDFVGHVFTCAGYSVECVANQFFPAGPGVDFNLYVGPMRGKPVARVEVRRYALSSPITFPDIAQFLGVLDLAQGVPGFLVTTSDFNGPAREAAKQANGKVHIINGQHLLRYITYIGGSRQRGEYAGASVAPTQPTAPTWLAEADIVTHRTARPPRTSRVVVVANTKGGVAKTTTALNIGFALADLYKQRTLLVDMDGQASLTHSVPPKADGRVPRNTPPPEETTTLADYFRGQVNLEDLVRPTRFDQLAILPASRTMYQLQIGGADRARAELRLVEDLRSLRPIPLTLPETREGDPGAYDWIVVDTPAGESFYARAALAAADFIMLPAHAEAYAQLGIEELLVTAKTMGALMGDVAQWKDRLLGCVITQWKPGTNAKANLLKLQGALGMEGIRLFREVIPFDDKVETAHRGTMAGGIRSIFRLSATMGTAARAYDELVKVMVEHVEKWDQHDTTA